MTLVEFIRARLDEEEKTAREAGDARIAWLTYCDEQGKMLYTTVAATGGDVWVAAGKELSAPATALIVYDPARVLTDVEAKRGMLRQLIVEGHALDYCDRCMVLRWLALPDAGHKDYQEEWRP